ncbi:thiamine diphosphokinase [Tepidimicrobium xylanilyticum]|uniref:Thiamine diphosphokinase n=1 Tax=Tepidimicrobium xylanilyticum TaxID=1123352 RepID=A0A1H2YQK7_9FIRM|nr:thiamine diphosphokinase [Tepidimicrobium xylanilyticum]GMG97185.1 thiamine pyrophosphokinase [Tepidimicrobium xylanilyticum]SDX07350.1 thiamine pyrophosphokinase [Tepidimicrobium xylanilyticum]
MKALVILSGKIIDINRLRELKKEVDFVLSADGGTNHCFKASLKPDLVVGDLDSISEEVIQQIEENKIPVEKFPVKKDKTDSEISIDYIIDKGFKDITIVGATGNRLDHTLANILLLKKLKERGINGRIIDDDNVIYLVEDELILKNIPGYYVSVIPITNTGIVVTLKGFEYELENTRVQFGSTLGISNRIVKDKGFIRIYEGQSLVIISRD